MATRIPLILNQTTSRIEELSASDTLPGTIIDGYGSDNAIINGDMSVWQRGETFGNLADARRYTADKFILWTGGGKAAQASRINMQDAAWLPPLAQIRPKNAMYVAVSAAGTSDDSFALIQQNIEGVNTYAGGPVTVSFPMWVDKATKIGVGFWQSYDDGGNVTTIDPVIIQLAAGWQLVTATLTLPALSTTKVRGPRNCLNLNIWLAASAAAGSGAPGIGLEAFTLWITNVKVEPGVIATGFRPRPPGLELFLSRRYFRSSFPAGEAPADNSLTSMHRVGTCFATTSMRVSLDFEPQMRAAPNMRFFSGAEVPSSPAARWGYYNAAIQTWVAGQATNVVNVLPTGAIIDVGAVSTTPGYAYLVNGQYTADADF